LIAAALRRYLGFLRRGLTEGAQWRLLLWWVVASALPALVVGLPLVAALDEKLDGLVDGADLSHNRTILLALELVAELRDAAAPIGGAAMVAAMLWLALVPWLHALFIAAARAPQPLRLGELVHGALAGYWRMVRLGLFALLPLGIALGAIALLLRAVQHFGERAVLEADVKHLRWAALFAGALIFAWAGAAVDAARAWLALHPSKRSAFKALWRGCRIALRHPLRAIGVYLGVALPGVILLLIVAAARVTMSTAGNGGMLGAMLLTQVLVAIAAWSHYARQFATLAWVRELAA